LYLGDLLFIYPPVGVDGFCDLIDVRPNAADLLRKFVVVGQVNIFHLAGDEHFERVEVEIIEAGFLHFIENELLFLLRHPDDHLDASRAARRDFCIVFLHGHVL